MVPRRRLREFLALTVTASVLVFSAGAAHASEPAGFGFAISDASGTGSHTLTWHGSYSCEHNTDATLLVAGVDQLSGVTLGTASRTLSCPAVGAPMHGTVNPLLFNWGNSVRLVATMTDVPHAEEALVTLNVTNDVAEVVTVDEAVVSANGTATYRGKFSCLTADDDAYLDIELTQVPHGGLATGLANIELTCPATPGSLAQWEATVSSLTGPFDQNREILSNIYVLHPGSLSGDDKESDDDPCDDYDDDKKCDDGN